MESKMYGYSAIWNTLFDILGAKFYDHSNQLDQGLSSLFHLHKLTASLNIITWALAETRLLEGLGSAVRSSPLC